MAIINLPDVAQKLFRRYRLAHPPSGILAEEIVPVTVVDDLSDYGVTAATRQCAGASVQGAVVGEYSFAALGAVSEVRVKVSGVWFSSSTAQEILVILSNESSITITAGEKGYLDRRIRGSPAATIGHETDAGLHTGTEIWRGLILADTPIYVPLGVILSSGEIELPGRTRMLVQCGTLNTNLRYAWNWSEGDLEG